MKGEVILRQRGPGERHVVSSGRTAKKSPNPRATPARAAMTASTAEIVEIW